MKNVERCPDNPIITSNDVPFRVNSIFNAGAVKVKDEYLLLCRIELPSGRSAFIIARSKNGINFSVDKHPCMSLENHGEWNEYVEWGIEDPRITFIDNQYYILYTGYSRLEPTVMLAKTYDFKKFEIIGTIYSTIK